MKVIFGDGVLGTELSRITNWKVISRKKDNIDITNPETYKYLLQTNKITEIINCIGYTNTNDNTKDLHWSINYLSVLNLVDLCNLYNIKLIQLSSDFIYGLSKNVADEETIPVHYERWYIYTKLLADAYVQARSKNYLLLRTSFKKRPFPYDTAWSDLIGNFDYVDVIANKIVYLINKNATGIFNVGTKLKSMVDLALQTNKKVSISLKGDHYNNNNVAPMMNINKLEEFINENN